MKEVILKQAAADAKSGKLETQLEFLVGPDYRKDDDDDDDSYRQAMAHRKELAWNFCN